MYESHFGLKASPFSLNPDPEFFFGSRDHTHALSYLKFGVFQGEGFVVVTGEIGAGKTTLVRTLLADLDPAKIVAAQIVSTQLEANDLLRSVALAFGIAPKNLSKAELIATIEAYLTLLVTEGRRALLVIDEAQNLDKRAVEELRMLSNFQFGNHALMQSFLVGQPELRALLTSKPMEQFRQRVIASCHVGPMSAEETRGYIEHRLGRAAWTGRPSFEDEAFHEICDASGGIPRRVNLLCNRLLLSAYLSSSDMITAADVERVASEVRAEMGEPAAGVAAPLEDLVSPQAQTRAPGEMADGAAGVLGDRPAAAPSSAGSGPVLVVAADRDDDIELSVLLRACRRHPAGTPALVRLRVGMAGGRPADAAFADDISGDVDSLSMDLPGGSQSERFCAAIRGIERVLVEQAAAVCVVRGESAVALAASLAARMVGCPVVHMNAGSRADAGPGNSGDGNGALIDRIAGGFYASGKSSYFNLIREGVDGSRVHLGAPLIGVAVRSTAVVPMVKRAALKQAGVPIALADGKRGYGLLLVDGPPVQASERERIRVLLAAARGLAADVPLVWPVDDALLVCFQDAALSAAADAAKITVTGRLDFPITVALVRGATLVVGDKAESRVLAELMGIRFAAFGSTDLARSGPISADSSEDDVKRFADWLVATFRIGSAGLAAQALDATDIGAA